MEKNISFGGGQGKLNFNMDNILRLQSELKKKYVAKVGIIGSADHEARKISKPRRETEITNASIGALHEFGDPARNIPIRSWLRMPIYLHLEDKKDYLQLAMYKSFKDYDIKKFFVKIGIAGEAVVQEGFDTSGWGAWPPPKYRDGSPLIDTGQLRKSVTSAVAMK